MLCTGIILLLSSCGVALCNPSAVKDRSYGRGIESAATYSYGKRAVGYYGNWDIYARDFFVTDIPAAELSHIAYAFANVNTTTGAVYLSDPNADLQYLYPGDVVSANGTNVYGAVKQLFLLKKKNRCLKVMLSIGGYTYSPNFVPILASESTRATFATTAVGLMLDIGMDGLDIDYEYVNGSTQAAQFVDLLQRLREQMDEYARMYQTTPFLLSFASPAGPQHYMDLDFQGMDKYLDFWNFLGFDYSGPWSSDSGHAANLFEDSSNPLSTPFSTNPAISYYIDTGHLSPDKINLGSPLYGRAFSDTDGPGTPYNGTGNNGSFGGAGIWDYKALPVPGYNATVVEIESIGASYSYDAAQKYMISYDTVAISETKAQYIMSNSLGGAMWWEVSMDKAGAESLISAAVNKFGGTDMLEKSLNHLSYPTSIYDNLRNGFPDD